MMPDSPDPMILELAPLPRDQIGPFLILGLPKSASQDEIEAHWAQRVIWSRKKLFRMPLEDVNWARESINSSERRVKADVTSLNADTVDLALQRSGPREGVPPLGWQPLDTEKPMASYDCGIVLPSVAEARAAIEVPQVPLEVPAVERLLQELVQEPLDPWTWTLPSETEQGS